jgi:hypothetical protein
MTYNFTEYKSAGERTRFVPQIILNQNGFTFSVGFSRKYGAALGDIKKLSVKLFYDEGKGAVGFKFVPDTEEGSVKLKILGHGGYFINARAFLVKYDLERSKYEIRYMPQEIDSPAGKLFVIELKRKSAG